jgi:hypothetical protein
MKIQVRLSNTEMEFSRKIINCKIPKMLYLVRVESPFVNRDATHKTKRSKIQNGADLACPNWTRNMFVNNNPPPILFFPNH